MIQVFSFLNESKLLFICFAYLIRTEDDHPFRAGLCAKSADQSVWRKEGEQKMSIPSLYQKKSI